MLQSVHSLVQIVEDVASMRDGRVSAGAQQVLVQPLKPRYLRKKRAGSNLGGDERLPKQPNLKLCALQAGLHGDDVSVESLRSIEFLPRAVEVIHQQAGFGHKVLKNGGGSKVYAFFLGLNDNFMSCCQVLLSLYLIVLF